MQQNQTMKYFWRGVHREKPCAPEKKHLEMYFVIPQWQGNWLSDLCSETGLAHPLLSHGTHPFQDPKPAQVNWKDGNNYSSMWIILHQHCASQINTELNFFFLFQGNFLPLQIKWLHIHGDKYVCDFFSRLKLQERWSGCNLYINQRGCVQSLPDFNWEIIVQILQGSLMLHKTKFWV